MNDPAEGQRLQADYAARVQESANFQLGGPAKLTRADDPRYVLRKNGGLADLWYMDDGDIMCHPILVPSFLQEFDVTNAKVGAERHPQKTEVIHNVNDLDAAPLEWSAGYGQSHHRHRGLLSDRDSTSRISSWPRRMSFEQCTNAFSYARTRRKNLLSYVNVWELAADLAGETGCRNLLRGQRSLGRLFPGQFDASNTQRWPV